MQRTCTKESPFTNFATQVSCPPLAAKTGRMNLVASCTTPALEWGPTEPVRSIAVRLQKLPTHCCPQDTKDGWTRVYAPLSAFDCVNKGDYGVRGEGG